MKSLPIVFGLLLLAPLPAAHPEIQQPDAKDGVAASLGDDAPGGEITIMLPGDVPLVMVRIPAGSFLMGSPEDERGRQSDEGPQTHVTLTRDFYMGKYPVTQAQYEAIMGSNPSHFPGRPNNPVERVNWLETQDFISALNSHISDSGKGPATMRLPTEAEWEYACRAGTTTRFYFGDSLGCDDFSEDCAAGTLPGYRSDYMWWQGNSSAPRSVGQKLPNGFGLYDMHGNVYEWCQDWWALRLPGGSVTDPTGPSMAGSARVLRGGSFIINARSCRSANRTSYNPGVRYRYFGFRLAMDAPLAPPEPELEVLVMALLGHEAPIAGADVNQDGVIDAADIVTLLEMASKSPTPSPTPPPDEGE